MKRYLINQPRTGGESYRSLAAKYEKVNERNKKIKVRSPTLEKEIPGTC